MRVRHQPIGVQAEALREEGNAIVPVLEERALASLLERLRETDDRIAALAEGTPVAHLLPEPGFFQRVAALFGRCGQHSADVDVVEALRRVRLLGDPPEHVLSVIAAYLRPVAADPGTFLCTEGEAAETLYLLVDGEVDVSQFRGWLGESPPFPLMTLSGRECSCIQPEQGQQLEGVL